ncbi:MAG TPA: NBR1-Ig-like domain-containing protein, partial [Thermoguttaceae bacterium]|nr:NBR1-Ig-like domain-containing protein [Thermoguttaceae bacterium]
MRNSGTTTWTAGANGHTLNRIGSAVLGESTYYSQLSSAVSPNSNGTFSIQFTAPSTPGTYTESWRMSSPGYVSFGDTVTITIVVPTAAPTVKVTSPNGGENWPLGVAHTITWSVTGDTSQINSFLISYSLDGGATYLNNVGTASSTNQSISWMPPLVISPTAVGRIRVQARDASNSVLSQDVSDGTFTFTSQQSAVTAKIDIGLLDLIDQYATTYYNSAWNLNVEQFKAWIATIARAEGGLGGYGAHSQYGGGVNGDAFTHTENPLFRFSTGIGPFQLDRGGEDAWGYWSTIDKLDPVKAVQTTMKQHQVQFTAGSTLANFSASSRWVGVWPDKVADQWAAVTGTNWDLFKAGKAQLDWNGVKTQLGSNASDPMFRYESNVQALGKKTWSIDSNDNLVTDTGKNILFNGSYDTWLVTARRWEGTVVSRYYYTRDVSTGIEVWVLDNAGASQNLFSYVFTREYAAPSGGQWPEHRASPGDVLASPALYIGSDTTPPTPNPSMFSTVPYATGTASIRMVATTASDPSGVQYYFDCLTFGGHDSGWQDSPIYEDTGLSAGTTYAYRVMARDKSPNQNAGDYSGDLSATTQQLADTTPPTVSISSPNNGQTFTTSSITVSGMATDEGGSGLFSVIVLNAANNSNGYQLLSGNSASFSVSGITLVQGSNLIGVQTFDNAGYSSTLATVTATYNPPDITAPAVAITYPLNNATVTSASLTVTGTASDSGRGNNGVSSVTVNGVSASGGTASGTNTANWSAGITL